MAPRYRQGAPDHPIFANALPQDAMRDLFDVDAEDDQLGNFAPLRAIFPRHDAPMVRRAAEGGSASGGRDARGGARELVPAHWGFVIPQRSARTGAPIQPKAVNNARDDKLRTSAFWRESFERRRCLIPATSFSEAQGRGPAIHHWFAVLGEDGAPMPFAFAGLWRRWRGLYRDEPREMDAVSMVTTTPNAVVAPVHPERMPMILAREDHAAWLEGTPEDALALIRPYPAHRMAVVGRGEGLRAQPEEVAL